MREETPEHQLAILKAENELLRLRLSRKTQYIRDKVDRLLDIMGTSALRQEELDDETLVDLDPIGIVADSFEQVLGHLHETNARLLNREEALRLSEERYRDLFENANDLIQSVAPDGRFIYTNRTWRETLGYSAREVRELTVFDIIDPSCHAHCESAFRQVMSGQKVPRVEVTFVAKDGRRIVVEGSANCNFENGVPIATRSIFRDVTQRKLAEEALATEKEQLAVTLRSIGDGVITTDTAGRVVLMNKIAEELSGYTQDEARGELLDTVLRLLNRESGELSANPVEEVLRTGRNAVQTGHDVLVTRGGGRRIIASSGAPICNRDSSVAGVVLVFRDVTEQETLKANLLRAEKLESLGILAGGIAHDFNNMLTGIVGNISLAKMSEGNDGALRTILDQAEKAALRATSLTQQLLTFAKGGAPVKQTSSIAELLTDLSNFALSGSNVRCSTSIPKDLWPGNIDPGQISQVIHNLVINADQAMPEGGMIFIGAENAQVTGRDSLPLRAGSYIRIGIRDTGVGIPPQNLPRIFDPYFTTKKKGSGLGLATAYSIVIRHDGCITVESEPGKGTTFHVYLPASPQATAASPQQKGSPVSGCGRILVMDDEQMIRDVAGGLLGVLGYVPYFAEHGKEAIELYLSAREKGEPFDAVIMDLTIPGGMGGKEAIRHLLEIDPEVKALVSSGYSTDPVLSDYRNYGFSGVVLKPYVVTDLSKALQSVLSKG